MAELLIKAVDASHEDPAKDARGCYKRGDVVVVMPDGHQWGRMEGPPDFFVLKIPGMSAEEAAELVSPETKPTELPRGIDVTARRSRRIDCDSLPSEYRRAIAERGVIQLPKAIVDRYNKRKSTMLSKFAERSR